MGLPKPTASLATTAATDFEPQGPQAGAPHDALPRHVGIIMDGNGRWAHSRGLPRGEGHRRGVEALRRAVRYAGRRNLGFLTLFSFSSENWSRPDEEIEGLFNLVRVFIRHDLAELNRNGVRVSVIGDRSGLPQDIRGLIEEAEGLTYSNRGLWRAALRTATSRPTLSIRRRSSRRSTLSASPIPT